MLHPEDSHSLELAQPVLSRVQIMGHGTIIAGSTLTMAATQKTFSVAVSRQMAPVARLIAYFIHDGEVVSDALNFHVSYSRLKVVSLSQNANPHEKVGVFPVCGCVMQTHCDDFTFCLVGLFSPLNSFKLKLSSKHTKTIVESS